MSSKVLVQDIFIANFLKFKQRIWALLVTYTKTAIRSKLKQCLTSLIYVHGFAQSKNESIRSILKPLQGKINKTDYQLENYKVLPAFIEKNKLTSRLLCCDTLLLRSPFFFSFISPAQFYKRYGSRKTHSIKYIFNIIQKS